MLTDQHIVLIIGGGIAAYKSLELIRRLKEQSAQVDVILTEGGAHFITPLSVASLSGRPAHTSLFDLVNESEMGHIRLAQEADIIIVAPATANLIGRAANGLAPDLAGAVLLVRRGPVLMAPAMNPRMWSHPATQRNVAHLKQDGIHIVGPEQGDTACGEQGEGRMAEPDMIVTVANTLLGKAPQKKKHALEGRRILVTSGPTHEPIDPVRYLANRSSGKQGHAIACAMAHLGAETVLVSGPVALPDPPGVVVHHVETAQEMLAACEAALPVDVAVCAAAVSDWRTAAPANQKIKKTTDDTPTFSLMENPDILATLSRHKQNRPRLVVGFAAETESLAIHAQDKRQRKKCDWIIANDVSPKHGVMGGDNNEVLLVTESGIEQWPTIPKTIVADHLAQRVADHLGSI
ncbi:MAG: bifunctional phosphopantothenoylcysteine decarboxylase/phosphopantothenate--cysteine ligase CoaBC [Parvularculales bacterium]